MSILVNKDMIKTIIFDLAEVYLMGLVGVEEKLAPILKISIKSAERGLHIKELTDLFEGKVSENEYWRKVIKVNKWNIKVNQLKRIVRDNFQEIHGVRETIERLRRKGFKLGLLSDHSKEWIDYCEKKFDFHKLFNSILYSFEVSVCKPNKKVYQLILDRLNAKPKECLFIDDSVRNIKSAKSLGINTIRFQNPEQLKKELASLSINI